MPVSIGQVIRNAALAALLFAGNAPAVELPRPLADYFDGQAACILLLTRDRHRDLQLELGGEHCEQARSPCSTFKIPNALIGLQTGAVSGPEHLKIQDGTVYQRPAENHDHTLSSAIKHSVVWYFRSLARDIGEEAMQDWLERLEYGNRDLSGGIDRFWLDSSLKIGARDQFELIRALWRGTLPFKEIHQQQVREMLRQDSELPGDLHGKTGTCPGEPDKGRSGHGWYVGWVDWQRDRNRNPATTWFTVIIEGADTSGIQARSSTLQLLADLQP